MEGDLFEGLTAQKIANKGRRKLGCYVMRQHWHSINEIDMAG